MEQIQIRQPKIAAAQSFIQILGTFLAKFFILIALYFSYIKKSIFKMKTAKTVGNTRFSIKNLTTFSKGEKCQRELNLRI